MRTRACDDTRTEPASAPRRIEFDNEAVAKSDEVSIPLAIWRDRPIIERRATVRDGAESQNDWYRRLGVDLVPAHAREASIGYCVLRPE